MALSEGQDDDALEQPSQFMLYLYDASGAANLGRLLHLQPSWFPPTHYLISEDCLFLSMTVEVHFDVPDPEFHSQAVQGHIPNLVNGCYTQRLLKAGKTSRAKRYYHY